MIAEHGLGGGTEGKALLELLAAAHGDPCHLGRKAVDELTLFFQKALRDEHRHGHIDVPGLFKLCVHDLLHILPDGVAIGAQDRKALDGGILHQLRLAADIGIPLGKIDLHIGDLLNFLVFRHKTTSQSPGPLPRRNVGSMRRVYVFYSGKESLSSL